MKTKHILTAMALPAMFAACTADDIVSENNGLQQDQRAKLSKDFVLNVNSEVESRYAVEGTSNLDFIFAEGDKIGANIIDLYADRVGDDLAFDKNDPATWQIVNTVSPALPFIFEGGVWKSANEELGIGNYLFTNPYNPADKNRAAASYELPVVVHYSSENPNAHIEAYNKAVAAQITYEGQTSANADMKNIFAYPMIRINFDKNLEVKKVTKVVLAKNYWGTKTEKGKEVADLKTGTPFIYKGAFNHEDVADMFNPKKIEKWLEENKATKATEDDYWAQFQTSDFIIDEADYDVDGNGTDETTIEQVIEAAEAFADIKTTPYFIYEMDETVVANSIDVRFMIPSIENLDATLIDNNERIMMYVCTDKGNFEMELTDLDNYQFSQTTLAALKNSAMQRNTSYTLKTLPGALESSSNATVFFNNIVSTAADWNKLVEEYGDLRKYSAEYNKVDATTGDKVNKDAQELIVNIISDKFALTSDLKMPEVAEFIIKSDVNVEGDVTLKNIKVEGEGKKLIVKKDATLTTDPTLNAPTVEVQEGGELVFAAEYNEDEELVAYTKVKTVNNHGTVTVPAGVEATFTLNNACKDAVLNVGAAASRAAEVADAVANLSGSNYGVINNYSVINAADLTNNAPVEKNGDEETGYEWDTEELVWNAAPAINNYGKFNAKGSVTNYGLFVNENVLTSNFVGAASFVNATAASQTNVYQGTLDIKAGAETYIDNNEGGLIVLAELNPTKGLTIYKARKNANFNPTNSDYKYRGIIKHTLAGKTTEALDLSASPVNYLVANADVEIAKTYTWTDSSASPAVTNIYPLQTLEVTNGIVTLAARTGAGTTGSPYVYPAQVANLIVNGEVEIDGEVYTPMIGALNVNAGGVFGIPADAYLKIALANITTATADTEKELAAGKVSVVGVLEFTEKNASNAAGVTTWPKGDDDKYTSADFDNKNIEINKDAEVKCDANAAASTTSPIKDQTITISNGNLYDAVKTGSWYANKAADAVWTVVIEGTLNMDQLIAETTTSTTDTNKDYVAVLTGAKEVILNGAKIENLKKGSAVIALTKLTVKGESSINGSKNVDILKVNELTVEAGAKFDIVNGYLVVNETAVEGRGNENINIAGVYTGKLIAYNADSEILYWDMTNSVWTKTASEAIDYSEVTVNAATAEDLAWAVENGVGNITLTDDVVMNNTLIITEPTVLNFNGKEISSTHELVQGKNAVLQVAGVELTIEDAKISSETCYAISVKDGGNLVIKSGEFTGNTTAVQATEGTVTIEGGIFYNDSESKYLLNCLDSNYKNGKANIVVKGGTFYNFNPAANLAETPAAGETSVSFVDTESSVVKVLRVATGNEKDVFGTKEGTMTENYEATVYSSDWAYEYKYVVE